MRTTMLCCGLAAALAGGPAAAQKVRDGEVVPRLLETPHPYAAPATPGAQRVWSDTLQHPGASYIHVHFERFRLADGDHVIVRSPDGSQAWRYEGLGRGGYGLDPRGFWASRIRGDTAVVELYAQAAGGGAYGYKIDRFAGGFGPGQGDLPVPTAICGADDSEWAKCYEDSEPLVYTRGRTVSRLHLPGGFTCTGWLVGCEGHLMTNNHCIASAFEAENTDYEFDAEGPNCETVCPSGACPGPVEATTGTLIKTHVGLDYSLILLPTNLSGSYGYLTLREEGPELDERIYIPQHPAGWGKRIAVFSDNGQDESGFCEVFSLSSPPCTGGPGDIGYFCDTQGGSSGSPVLGYADHKVVALHHCANCPNRGLDIADVIANIGGDLPACALEQFAGTVELDREVYGCADTIEVTVVDDSIQGAGTQPVTLTSDSESTPETVVLDETFPGIFVGTLPTTAAAPTPGDGSLSLADGDAVVAEYIDADDGAGGVDVPRQDTALTDCAGPVISDVQVAAITSSSAVVSWTTDEPGDSLVEYGVESVEEASAANPTLVTDHSVTLHDVEDCSQHVFRVSSTDALANPATDDNEGNLYGFMSLCQPPVPIPDGSAGTLPITVFRRSTDGSQLTVYWDDQCSPTEAHLLYGALDQVASYAIDGALCELEQPQPWDSVPTGNLWFLLAGKNAIGLESSWGRSSFGERKGLTASHECGTTFKNPQGQCP